MRKIVKIAFILCTFIISSNILFAKKYVEGYIKSGKDTIRCYIEDSEYFKGNIKYKLSLNDNKALKIKALYISHLKCGPFIYDRVFVSSETSHLMRRIIQGNINLYKWFYIYNSGGGYNFSTGISSVGSSGIGNDYFLIKDGEIINYDKPKHKKHIRKFFTDNLELLKEVDDLKGKFHKENLETIIQKYNTWHRSKSQ